MRLVRRLSGADDRGVHPVRGLVRELHARTREPRLGEAVEVLGLRQGSGDAPNVGTAVSTLFGGEAVFGDDIGDPRSEEHTSELQSRGHLVCRLLLAKKKQKTLTR